MPEFKYEAEVTKHFEITVLAKDQREAEFYMNRYLLHNDTSVKEAIARHACVDIDRSFCLVGAECKPEPEKETDTDPDGKEPVVMDCPDGEDLKTDPAD